MLSATLNLHQVTKIEFVRVRSGDFHWVNMKVYDEEGGYESIGIFSPESVGKAGPEIKILPDREFDKPNYAAEAAEAELRG